MLAASIDGFLLLSLAACYELTSLLFLCFSCLIQLLFVENKFFFLSFRRILKTYFSPGACLFGSVSLRWIKAFRKPVCGGHNQRPVKLPRLCGPIVFWWYFLIQIIWKLLMHSEKNSIFSHLVNNFRSGTLNLWTLMVLTLTLWDGIVFSCNLQLICCYIALSVLLLLLSVSYTHLTLPTKRIV